MKKKLLITIVGIIILTAGIFIGETWQPISYFGETALLSPISKISQVVSEPERPLLQYSIENLKNYDFNSSDIQIEEIYAQEKDYSSLTFSYTTVEKKMTGVMNLPNSPAPQAGYPVIVMIRGWVPAESYYPGMGTKNAAAYFAQNGYTTVAIDFFGHGGSDDDLEDSWEGRFIKPINVIELMKSLEKNPQPTINEDLLIKLKNETIKFNTEKMGIWAHSNGGQIALTTLEVLSEPIPTTLWAPVTAPFPYSILFFTYDLEDEGKESRAWIAMFEEIYDVFDFSLTQHLDLLTGPIQIQHGTTDKDALIAWSDLLVTNIDKENDKRDEIREELELLTASDSAQLEEPLDNIDLSYYRHPGADHNLRPAWNNAVQKDLAFFNKHLNKPNK